MAIQENKVIDAIGLDQEDHLVVLTISDHLDWEDERHLIMLQDKLNCYLSYIESGELVESYPKANGLRVKISLVCKYPPTEDTEEFLSQVQKIINSAGFEFECSVFDKT